MRAIWTGGISFGLVNIPIKLYPAAQEHILGFKILCGKCNNPLSMRRWCSHCKKEVTWDHVVKGFELHKGEYFVVTQEVLKSLKPTKTTTINIHSFVDAELIDPAYRDTVYYAAPGTTQRSYTLFAHALEASGKVAIGTFVMRDRERVCMIQSYHSGLLLNTLYYSYEVRPMEEIKELKHEVAAVSSGELKLAKQLIDQMTEKKLDMTQFRDTFAQELKKLIKSKREGKIVELAKEKPAKRRGKKETASLMDVLKESLHEARR